MRDKYCHSLQPGHAAFPSWRNSYLIAALTREHGGGEQARLRTADERSRVQCLVPARGARRGKALDEGSAAIPRDAVARNASGEPPPEAGARHERTL